METRTLSEMLKEDILAKYKTIPLHPVTLEDALAIALRSGQHPCPYIHLLQSLFGEQTDLSYVTIVLKNRRTSFIREYHKIAHQEINGRRLSDAKKILIVRRIGKRGGSEMWNAFFNCVKKGVKPEKRYAEITRFDDTFDDKPETVCCMVTNYHDPYKKKIALTIIYV